MYVRVCMCDNVFVCTGGTRTRAVRERERARERERVLSCGDARAGGQRKRARGGAPAAAASAGGGGDGALRACVRACCCLLLLSRLRQPLPFVPLAREHTYIRSSARPSRRARARLRPRGAEDGGGVGCACGNPGSCTCTDGGGGGGSGAATGALRQCRVAVPHSSVLSSGVLFVPRALEQPSFARLLGGAWARWGG